MEKIPQKQEQVSLYEVKIAMESDENSIFLNLERRGLAQFIVTKNFDIFITHLGHDALRFANGLQWNDITFRGYARKNNNTIEVYFYDKPAEKEREDIEKVIKRFLGSLHVQGSEKKF
ncbi:MAG: hypothetical protein KGI50_04305 [Patescibacteria group bacterium]|nr:hypothetical protein [Patescibacteria group bacterium]MDE2438492.1 hypothetical protein [Patescibacteria group bacterium]